MNRKTARVLLVICSVLFVAAFIHCNRGQSAAADGSKFQIQRTVVMSGLSDPWDLAFAPDGAMLFTEKCRGLSVRTSDGKVRHLFGTTGAALEAKNFFCQGQSGMLGVALDPDFAKNRYAYVYMASKIGKTATNHVVRFTVDKTYTVVANRKDIVTDIPFKQSFNRWGGAGAHSGGRIRFSPFDGYLYVTTGDNHNGTLPQDLSRLGGKVLRIDRDGKAANGNNTPSGGDPRIFTYGHRNVQGITFRPGTGQAFISEHGPGHNDEVTPLAAGGNGGWDPAPTKGVSCPSNYCGYTSNKPDGTLTPMTDLARFPKALKPSWNNRGVSEGMGPCVFLSGSHWKSWEGRLAVGFLRGERIELLQLDAVGTTTRTTTVTGLPQQRMRSLVLGPDGAMYVATDAGEIWRLESAVK
ncbi:MAG: PQQ-dependent sugar dehydrogenase [Desulfuromonadaceae bacterium]